MAGREVYPGAERTMSHRQPSRATRRRGFTLTELVLALALSGLIGSAAVVVLYSVSTTMTAEVEFRRAMVRRQVAISRLGAITRSAGRVLDLSGDRLTLWTGDANRDDRPNLSELMLISWQPGSKEITVYETPEDFNPLDDVAYNFDDDFKSMMNTIVGSAAFPGEVVFRRVGSWEVTLDDPDVQSARRLRLRMTIENEGASQTATVLSSLRTSG